MTRKQKSLSQRGRKISLTGEKTLGNIYGRRIYAESERKLKFKTGDFVYLSGRFLGYHWYDKNTAFQITYSSIHSNDGKYIVQYYGKEGYVWENRGIEENEMVFADKQPPIIEGMLAYAGKTTNGWQFAANIEPAFYNKKEDEFYYCIKSGKPTISGKNIELLDANKLPECQFIIINNKSRKGYIAVARYDRKKKKVFYDIYECGNRKKVVAQRNTLSEVREFANSNIRGRISEITSPITKEWTWGRETPHFITDTEDCYKDFLLKKPKFNMTEKAFELYDRLEVLRNVNQSKKYRK